MREAWIRATLLAVLAAGVLTIPTARGQDAPAITRDHLRFSQNNLKQMGLAFHNFHDVNNGFPGNITDKDGTALLSWRVAILPYIEEDTLYRQFKLDEPWDSTNNKKLIEKMPKLYAPVRVKAKEGETFYQVFTGEKAMFSGKNKPRIISITDGTSNTGMVFEGGEPVIWSKPADLAFDEKKPLPKLGGLFDGDFFVCMCDGSVRRIKKDADEGELKKLIMPADGNVIDFKKLDK